MIDLAARSAERLLVAAEQVFLEKGFVATTMDEVAAGAGMSKKTVYKLFSSKSDLFRAVLKRPNRKAALRPATQFSGTTEQRLEKALITIGRFIFSPSEVALQRLIIREARIAPDLAEVFAALLVDPDPLGLVEILRDFPETASRKPDELAELAQMLMGTAFGAFHFKLMVSDAFHPSDQDLKRRVRKAVQIFLNGIAASSRNEGA